MIKQLQELVIRRQSIWFPKKRGGFGRESKFDYYVGILVRGEFHCLIYTDGPPEFRLGLKAQFSRMSDAEKAVAHIQKDPAAFVKDHEPKFQKE